MSRRRALVLAAVWTLPSIVFLAITWAVYAHFRVRVGPRLGDDARVEAVRVLRAALEGQGGAAPPSHPELARRLPDGGPLTVGVWLDGVERLRVTGAGETIGDGLADAAARLAAHAALPVLSPEERTEARIKVDVSAGRGPLVRGFAGLDSVAMNPGLDGIGVVVAGQIHVVLPDEMFLAGLVTKNRPIPMIPDATLGADLDKAEMLLATRAALPAGEYGAAGKHYFRFRSDAFIERPASARTGAPLRLYRGLPPGPALTAATLKEAALDGARYLVAHLGSNGRYVYERNLTTGVGTDPLRKGPYSVPRHAGATYFLAEVYRITHEEFLREPIELAFAHLQDLIELGGCAGTLPGTDEPFECVVDKGEKKAGLGSTALTVVALAEYQRATGDTRYQALATRLAAWILFMQRPDGSFAHQYVLATKTRNEKLQTLYYSGEAALAMARMHLVTGDERYLAAAEKAIDWLIDFYDFFIGGFIYGEEHWTCIAANAAYPAIQKERWAEFCAGYGRFLRDQQPEAGDHPDQIDMVGSYGVTPFLIANNTPAGSRTEAMISAYLLTRNLGEPDEAIRQQVFAAMRFALRQQIRADNDFAVKAEVPGIGHGHGAVPTSGIDRNVRIDYIQHVCSAMIRTIELLDETADPASQ